MFGKLKAIRKALEGRKTYIVMGIMVAALAIDWATGESGTLRFVRDVLTVLGGGTVTAKLIRDLKNNRAAANGFLALLCVGGLLASGCVVHQSERITREVMSPTEPVAVTNEPAGEGGTESGFWAVLAGIPGDIALALADTVTGIIGAATGMVTDVSDDVTDTVRADIQDRVHDRIVWERSIWFGTGDVNEYGRVFWLKNVGVQFNGGNIGAVESAEEETEDAPGPDSS